DALPIPSARPTYSRGEWSPVCEVQAAELPHARAPAPESRARAAPPVACASVVHVFRSRENRDATRAAPRANPGGPPDGTEANCRKSVVGGNHQETETHEV